MPLYTVLRRFPGATETDLQAAAFRSLTCLPYHSGLAWLRSYWDAESEALTCIFEARSEEDIRFHAERASIPCDSVIQVQEFLPADLVAHHMGEAVEASLS